VSLVRQLLVDPVPEVRMLAASYLAEYAEEAETLKDLLSDKGQEEDFKKAVLAGLSASQTRTALDVLLWSLSATPELIHSAVEALSRRTSALDVEYILKAYSTSDMRKRSLIAKSFSLIYSIQRDVSCLTDFLASENQAVRASASEILEYTGWVEEQRRALESFSSETRLSTVKRLSDVYTFSAFQGILCAARDPDRRVREEAFRALRGFPEKLMRDFRKRIAETPDTKMRTVAEKVFLNLR
jgi:HEAT repeat protein